MSLINYLTTGKAVEVFQNIFFNFCLSDLTCPHDSFSHVPTQYCQDCAWQIVCKWQSMIILRGKKAVSVFVYSTAPVGGDSPSSHCVHLFTSSTPVWLMHERFIYYFFSWLQSVLMPHLSYLIWVCLVMLCPPLLWSASFKKNMPVLTLPRLPGKHTSPTHNVTDRFAMDWSGSDAMHWH